MLRLRRCLNFKHSNVNPPKKKKHSNVPPFGSMEILADDASVVLYTRTTRVVTNPN